jgi:ActR/RegA family two-component response regulator/HPt (histidine-containing phosphotransfer) domain-containing protein
MRQCLVIDDDAIASTFLGEWLSARGWQVVCARTLAEAATRLTAASYDIALVDRRLPDGDGLAWLACGALVSTTRCLVTSGDAIDARTLPAGVDCMRKPLDVDRLEAWLAQSESSCSIAATDQVAAPVDLPLLDDATALARFGGNADALRSLRTMLLAELRDSASWRAQLRESTPTTAALDALHRLRAASALTGCARLGSVSEALENDLRRGLPASAKSLAELDATIDATIAEIAGLQLPMNL